MQARGRENIQRMYEMYNVLVYRYFKKVIISGHCGEHCAADTENDFAGDVTTGYQCNQVIYPKIYIFANVYSNSQLHFYFDDHNYCLKRIYLKKKFKRKVWPADDVLWYYGPKSHQLPSFAGIENLASLSIKQNYKNFKLYLRLPRQKAERPFFQMDDL